MVGKIEAGADKVISFCKALAVPFEGLKRWCLSGNESGRYYEPNFLSARRRSDDLERGVVSTVLLSSLPFGDNHVGVMGTDPNLRRRVVAR